MNPKEYLDFIIMLKKRKLQFQKHIKKYIRLRKLHSEIIDNMEDYLEKGKYDLSNLNVGDSSKSLKDMLYLELDSSNPDDVTIIVELLVYKRGESLTSLTETYLNKNKLRNKEKVKMLNAMNESIVSLFKIVDANHETGYVTYEDAFTGKRYEVVDMAMSCSLVIDKKDYRYMVNRLITYEDITFGTGLHCIMSEHHKGLKEFIKKNKGKKVTTHTLLSLYQLSKTGNNVKTKFHHNY